MTPYVILDDPSLVSEPPASSPVDARENDEELDDVNKHGGDIDEEYIDLLRAVFMPAEQVPSSPIDEGYADFLRSISDDAAPPAVEGPSSPTIEELWSEVIDGGGMSDDAARLGIDELLDGMATNDDIDIEARSESDDGSFVAFVDNLHREGGVIRLPVVVDGDGVECEFDRGDSDFDAFLAHINSRRQRTGRGGPNATTAVDNFDFLPSMRNGDTVEAVWSRIVSGMSDAPAEPPSWFWSWFGYANAATASSSSSTSEAEAEAGKKTESKGGDDDTVASEVEPPPSWFGSWWYGVQPMDVRREVDPAEQEESFV